MVRENDYDDEYGEYSDYFHVPRPCTVCFHEFLPKNSDSIDGSTHTCPKCGARQVFRVDDAPAIDYDMNEEPVFADGDDWHWEYIGKLDEGGNGDKRSGCTSDESC